jgi:hypothetical protein
VWAAVWAVWIRDNGPCNLNGLGHGMPFSEGKCSEFRLAYSREANFEIYDELWEVENVSQAALAPTPAGS